jgi:flagellar biosynthesis protein FlhG
LASIRIDQAEGLRRLIVKPAPRQLTFLSAAPDADKCAMLLNLGASLAGTGASALLIDACQRSRGAAAGLERIQAATLLQASRGEARLADAVLPMPQGFSIAALGRGEMSGKDRSRMETLFSGLAASNDILLADAELDAGDALPLAAMAQGELVLHVADSAASITAAYALMKRISVRHAQRQVGILITGAEGERAGAIYQNLASAASRYLALEVHPIGSVPEDEHLARATRQGRTVIDAFPTAGAARAFRDLAGRVARRAMPSAGRRHAATGSAMLGA